MIVLIPADAAGLVVAPVVVVPVVVVAALLVAAAHRVCSSGKFARASSASMLSRQLVRWLRSSALAPPIERQAARALPQLIALALADLLSAEVAFESCWYSALVSVPLGAAASAGTDIKTAIAADIAAVVVAIRMARGIDRA
jgi:hypothetical protein